ncbi:aminotransferase class I/II-fold pyridoxal phosphate-dependent enzyme, partial [Escherichia coli]
NFDYLLNQRGMFSYTGLSAAQVDRLREEFGVYLIASGRMCVAVVSAITQAADWRLATAQLLEIAGVGDE